MVALDRIWRLWREKSNLAQLITAVRLSLVLVLNYVTSVLYAVTQFCSEAFLCPLAPLPKLSIETKSDPGIIEISTLIPQYYSPASYMMSQNKDDVITEMYLRSLVIIVAANKATN